MPDGIDRGEVPAALSIRWCARLALLSCMLAPVDSTAETEAPILDVKKELTALIAIEGDTKQVLESRNELGINSLLSLIHI